MDVPREIVGVILDIVCDTRSYSCVSKCAREQATARPDHTIWLKIRTAADHFIHGTAATVTWALANVPELAALDGIGLAVALANAVQADNAEVTAVLIPLVKPELLYCAARYCSGKTYELFNVNWSQVDLCNCRCLLEIGLDFEKLYRLGTIGGPWVRAVSSEYLCKMLPSQPDPELIVSLLEVACEYSLTEFGLEIVRRHGTEYIARAFELLMIFDLWKYCGLKLVTALAGMVGFNIGNLREHTIARGRIEELDTDGVTHVRDLERQIIDGSIGDKQLFECRGRMIEFIADHAPQSILDKLLNSKYYEYSGYLSVILISRGKSSRNIDMCGIKYIFAHPVSARLAVAQRKFNREKFIGSNVNMYILCAQLDGFE